MLQKVNIVWCGIATFGAAQQVLNEVKNHQDILDLPTHARNFALRFASYIKRCPKPVATRATNITHTQMEQVPLYHIGFFSFEQQKQEVTFMIGYNTL